MDRGLMHTDGLLALRAGEVLRLRNPAGRHIGVVRGSVWVTQEGDPQDYVLGSGESMHLPRGGLALVLPLGGEAKLVLEQGLAAASGVAQLEFSPRGADIAYFERRAHLLRGRALAQAWAALSDRLKAHGRQIARWWREGAQARNAARELRLLSDRTLQDIGLRRDQIDCVTRTAPC